MLKLVVRPNLGFGVLKNVRVQVSLLVKFVNTAKFILSKIFN